MGLELNTPDWIEQITREAEEVIRSEEISALKHMFNNTYGTVTNGSYFALLLNPLFGAGELYRTMCMMQFDPDTMPGIKTPPLALLLVSDQPRKLKQDKMSVLIRRGVLIERALRVLLQTHALLSSEILPLVGIAASWMHPRRLDAMGISRRDLLLWKDGVVKARSFPAHAPAAPGWAFDVRWLSGTSLITMPFKRS